MGRNDHGGDVYRHENIIDFSASCNPLGPPEQVVQAVRDAAARIGSYPDPIWEELRFAIAEDQRVDASRIFVGNGAAEVIFALARCIGDGRGPKRALIPVPTFSEYEEALVQAGWEPVFFDAGPERGFAISEDILGEIGPDIGAVFVCVPNNPSGALTDRKLLMEMLRRCEKTGALLVADESFMDFVPDAAERSLVRETADHRGLAVIRAFTKIYAMAGVRLGYCVSSDTGLLARMSGCVQPWNVSLLAQEAGLAALRCDGFIEKTGEYIEAERTRLVSELAGLGLGPAKPSANFILFRADPGLGERLLERGILVRDCRSFRGLGPGYYRIAVRTREENDALIDALKGAIWQR